MVTFRRRDCSKQKVSSNQDKLRKWSVDVRRKLRYLILITSLWSFFLLGLYIHKIHDHPSIESVGQDVEEFPYYQVSKGDNVLKYISPHSNLPTKFWLKNYRRKNFDCGRIPNILELKFNNIIWQQFHSPTGKFYFYSAHYDSRSIFKTPKVKIIAMIDRRQPGPTFCQIWHDKMKRVLVSKVEYEYSWVKKWGVYPNGVLQPFILTCEVSPIEDKILPEAVSIVEQKCDNTTNLLKINVVPSENSKKDIGVCVKGLSLPYDSMILKLIEWLEMMKILGADKIFMYKLYVHPVIAKVLRLYQKKNFVDLKPLTLPGDGPNEPFFRHFYLKRRRVEKRLNELVPYNDCLYRNIHRFRYIALLDVDELIVPQKVFHWRTLLSDIESKMWPKTDVLDSICARHVIFSRKFSSRSRFNIKSHFLSTVHRARNFSRIGERTKCFHSTERLQIIHNHLPLKCSGGCHSYSMPTEEAILHHYRDENQHQEEKGIEESRMLDYEFKLQVGVNRVLEELDISF